MKMCSSSRKSFHHFSMSTHFYAEQICIQDFHKPEYVGDLHTSRTLVIFTPLCRCVFVCVCGEGWSSGGAVGVSCLISNSVEPEQAASVTWHVTFSEAARGGGSDRRNNNYTLYRTHKCHKQRECFCRKLDPGNGEKDIKKGRMVFPSVWRAGCLAPSLGFSAAVLLP